jgi:hypothetical protein
MRRHGSFSVESGYKAARDARASEGARINHAFGPMLAPDGILFEWSAFLREMRRRGMDMQALALIRVQFEKMLRNLANLVELAHEFEADHKGKSAGRTRVSVE